jgi:alkanesulfonate monooxygenase SsuD/methylene tetrahydromethanopterin reductase-like flavin-dependent oxidoreductase (luciferase family)
MEIGIGIGTAPDIATAAREVEAAGFDAVHCGEHLFFHGPTPHALAALSVAAAVTERVRLLSAVTLLPLAPAAAIAKLATSVDIASHGRLDLGLGIGGEYPKEFAAVGVPVQERGARSDEALLILEALFSGEPATLEGRWARLDEVRLRPRPVQPGGPRLWLAGRKGAALLRAARHADVWMPYMVTPGMFADGLHAVRAAAADFGRDPASIDGAIYGFFSVDGDGDLARRRASEFAAKIYGQAAGRFLKYMIAGTPEECVTRLREFEAAGASSAQLNIAAPADAAPLVTRLLAEEVAPMVRSALGSAS